MLSLDEGVAGRRIRGIGGFFLSRLKAHHRLFGPRRVRSNCAEVGMHRQLQRLLLSNLLCGGILGNCMVGPLR